MLLRTLVCALLIGSTPPTHGAEPKPQSPALEPCITFAGKLCFSLKAARAIAAEESRDVRAIAPCAGPDSAPKKGCATLLTTTPAAPERFVAWRVEDAQCPAPAKAAPKGIAVGDDGCFGGHTSTRRAKGRVAITVDHGYLVSQTMRLEGFVGGRWATAGTVELAQGVWRSPKGVSFRLRRFRVTDPIGKTLASTQTVTPILTPTSDASDRCKAESDSWQAAAELGVAAGRVTCDLQGLNGKLQLQLSLQPAGIGGTGTYVYDPQLCANLTNVMSKAIAFTAARLREKCLADPGAIAGPETPPDPGEPPVGGPIVPPTKPIQPPDDETPCPPATWKQATEYATIDGQVCTTTQTVSVSGAVTASGECEISVTESATVCSEEAEQ